MIEAALLANTLVCLPTGLGKTLIAAVVMYNFSRWFPQVLTICPGLSPGYRSCRRVVAAMSARRTVSCLSSVCGTHSLAIPSAAGMQMHISLRAGTWMIAGQDRVRRAHQAAADAAGGGVLLEDGHLAGDVRHTRCHRAESSTRAVSVAKQHCLRA